MRRARAMCDLAFHPGYSVLIFISFLTVTCIWFQIIFLLKLICHEKDKLLVKENWYLLN